MRIYKYKRLCIELIKPDTKEVIHSLTSFKNTKKIKKEIEFKFYYLWTCQKELVEKLKKC